MAFYGLLLIVMIQYLTFAVAGTVYRTEGWLYVNLLFAAVPMMFLLPYFNRYFFRLTGRLYLGPIATCLIFVMILLSNTVCYLPLSPATARPPCRVSRLPGTSNRWRPAGGGYAWSG